MKEVGQYNTESGSDSDELIMLLTPNSRKRTLPRPFLQDPAEELLHNTNSEDNTVLNQANTEDVESVQSGENDSDTPINTEHVLSSPNLSPSPSTVKLSRTYSRPTRQRRPPDYLHYTIFGNPASYPIIYTIQVPSNVMMYSQLPYYYSVPQPQCNLPTTVHCR